MNLSHFKLERINLNMHSKMLIIAIFDALVAQFYFDSLPFEFKFSISVAILPIYYYFDRTLNPIKTGFYVMSVGLIFRTLTQANLYGSFAGAFWSDFPFAIRSKREKLFLVPSLSSMSVYV